MITRHLCLFFVLFVYSGINDLGVSGLDFRLWGDSTVTEESCQPDEFKCNRTRICIPLSYKCDGNHDCGFNDWSDENFDTCGVHFTCPPNQSPCMGLDENSRIICIHTVYFCNKIPNCPDNSDEWDHCNQNNVKDCALLGCEYGCNPTRFGPKCYCPFGMAPKVNKCEDIDECNSPNTCDQLCRNTNGSYQCSCVEGYKKISSTACQPVNDPDPPIILMTNNSRIMLKSFDMETIKSSLPALHVHAMDYDYTNRRIYYIHNNLTKHSLVSVSFDNLQDRKVLSPPSIYPGLRDVTAIAFDWISMNWYIVTTTPGLVMVCENELKICRIIMMEGVADVTGFVLDPTRGFMFWLGTKNVVPKMAVFRSSLSGTEKIVLIKPSHTELSGLSIYLPTGRIYWVDNPSANLVSLDYDGSNRQTYTLKVFETQISSMALFGTSLFFALTNEKKILSIARYNSSKSSLSYPIDGQPLYINIIHRQKQPMVPHPCRKNNGGCQHLCITGYHNETPVAVCLCAYGYRQQGVQGCVLEEPSSFLIIAGNNPALIKSAMLNNPKTPPNWEPMIPVTDLNLATVIDYDVETKSIYYFDMGSMRAIYRQKLDGTYKKEFLSDGVYQVNGLAVDWIGRNLYWSDEITSSISVSKLDDSNITATIVERKPHRKTPMTIAVDPYNGWLFWFGAKGDRKIVSNDYGTIYRADMSGSNQEVLVDKVLWVSGMFVNYDDSKLYWCDERAHIIESSDFDGKNRKVLVANDIWSPRSVFTVNGVLFWAEHTTGTIKRKINESYYDIFSREEFGHILDVKLYDVNRQTGSNKCSRDKPCPVNSICAATSNDSYRCLCADKYVFLRGKCIYSGRNTTSSSPCASNEFHCGKGHCIDSKLMCDGENDCYNNLDEDKQLCSHVECSTNQFRCDINRCIDHSDVCDGVEDCADGSDESVKACSQLSCEAFHFQCENTRRCIPIAWKCNRVQDCGKGDYSDEKNCNVECEPNEFQCDNGYCIPDEQYCDYRNDCHDYSDEINCPTMQCDPITEMACYSEGNCIPKIYKCDGKVDCSDGIDEDDCSHINSTRIDLDGSSDICERHEFTCTDMKECIRLEFKCDGHKDCLDGSDERGCNYTNVVTTVSPLHINTTIQQAELNCSWSSRVCDNNTKCLELTQLCDGVPDCNDGSDEGLRCDEDLCTFAPCSHLCMKSPEGPVCSCPPHYYLQSDGHQCGLSHPCTAWGVCSQSCEPRRHGHKCTCDEGFQLADDGFTCRSTDSSVPLLIYSDRHEIRSVELTTLVSRPLQSSLKNTIALDFFIDGGVTQIYWNDVTEDKIYRANLIGGYLSKIEAIVESGIKTAEGLAVDWIGQKLYWVESQLDQIEVCQLDGKYRKSLISGDMDCPRAVAIDSRDGLIFWTDWEQGAPRIERASLAGQRRAIIARVDILAQGEWPNGLTLDLAARRIYWVDARSDSIHTIKYDGSDHHPVITGHSLVSHPFAITLYENYIYWTDWSSGSVVKAQRWNASDVKKFYVTVTQPFDLKIVHPSRQPKGPANPCQTNNGYCSHLCLVDGPGASMCACPHLMNLGADLLTCEVHNKVMLIGSSMEIIGVDLEYPNLLSIPPINSARLLPPPMIAFYAANSTLYWPDDGVIYRKLITWGSKEALIDAGVDRSSTLAIDWQAGLLFYTSVGSKTPGILVSNLDGEYVTQIIQHHHDITGLVVDPRMGSIYFTWYKDRGDNQTSYVLERAHMDDTERSVILTSETPISNLVIHEGKYLCYLDVTKSSVFKINLSTLSISNVTIPTWAHPTSFITYKSKLYFGDGDALYVCELDNCAVANSFRSNTKGTVYLNIYASDLQPKIVSSCDTRHIKCQHLCLPTSNTTSVCKCAVGYVATDRMSIGCKAVDDILIYSNNLEIKGMRLDGDTSSPVLGPISHVITASWVDYNAKTDTIFWSDSERGNIMKVQRDGTRRETVIQQYEPKEDTMLEDWSTGMAVDWLSGNIYWSDSKRNVIEVARLDGTYRYVLIADDEDVPHALTLDPTAGYLFYTSGNSIRRSRLDGTNSTVIYTSVYSTPITALTLDREKRLVYWCTNNTVMYMGYTSRSKYVTVFRQEAGDIVAMSIYTDTIYWADKFNEGGCIRQAPLSNMSHYSTLSANLGSSLTHVTVYSSALQKGTNGCVNNNGGCKELCLPTAPGVKCVCPNGNLAPDGVSCIPHNIFLMYSAVSSINSINVFDESNFNVPYLPIKNRDIMRNAIALTYNYRDSMLYYSDLQRGGINMVHFNGTGHETLISAQGSVEGLSYEPLSRTLFWSSNSMTAIRKTLLGLDHKSSEVVDVVKLMKGDRPRGVDVDPCETRVYWTNWNPDSPSIQRARFNGYQVQTIIDTQIYTPNAIVLDKPAKKVYWTDARLDKIERCEYDGTLRVVVTKSMSQHPFDIAVFGEYLYWTDWVEHAVVKANKHTGLESSIVRDNIPRPMGIIAVAPYNYTCGQGGCSILNGRCSQLCRLDSAGNVVCYCRPSYTLMNDGRTCAAVVDSRWCRDDEIKGPTYQCAEGKCIPYALTCDGVNHCADTESSSDEDPIYCSTRTCMEGTYQCATQGRCIEKSSVCDGRADCPDDSDESNCTCNANQFRCTDGQCIPLTKWCDGQADCGHYEDEVGCPRKDCRATGAANCRTSSDCFFPLWRCDGETDCMDGSDEENCTMSISNKSPSLCGEGRTTCRGGRCILSEWRCDGRDDCKDGKDGRPSSDEENCLNVKPEHCLQTQFECASSNASSYECIDRAWVCDGNIDCTDGSDEADHCLTTSLSSDGVCKAWQFRCDGNDACLDNSKLCDGIADCSDGSDEQDCPCDDSTSFRCATGSLCLHKLLYCDGNPDCSDGSDEPPGCWPAVPDPIGYITPVPGGQSSSVCGARCLSGACVARELVCDGRDHCMDSNHTGPPVDEDPLLCASLDRNGDDLCRASEWRCNNGVCVTRTELCDGVDQCGDYSDESHCNVNECNNNICSQNCTDLPVGYSCWCKPGFRLSTDLVTCKDVDECTEDDPCDQTCRNTYGSFVCSCYDGYTLSADRITCLPDSDLEAKLIFTNRYYIRNVGLAPNSPTNLIVHNLTNSVAVDFDWSTDCLYWSDVTRHAASIKRVCGVRRASGALHNGTYQVLHSATLQNPDGLAVDWVAGNIYWCDKGTDTVEVSRLDGKHRKVILRGGLQEPRAVALNPFNGTLYWSDWGDSPHIGRAGMDGSEREIIISERLGWPNALTINIDTKELYFADAREDYIAVADLDGSNIRKLFSRTEQPSLRLHHVFAVAVWAGQIYWSDWETKSIEACRRRPYNTHLIWTGNNSKSLDCHTVTTLVHKPMDLRIYHPYRQKPMPDLSKQCQELDCAGLCLLTPDPKQRVKCSCPEHFVLAEDGRNCKANCSAAQFQCQDTLKCIPYWWRCDTQDDCGDRSDEPDSCPTFNCNPGEFQCDGKKCHHPSTLCDGIAQCADMSDERSCDQFTCLSSQFKCSGNSTMDKSARCIPIKHRCNGRADCINGDDEIDCPPATCEPAQLKCKDGTCVPLVWVCDTDMDCPDGSDELHCTERKCQENEFRCSSGRCIPFSWWCDGDKDCMDGEDETDKCLPTVKTTCEPTYFMCPNGKCIPGRWRCDYDNDCGDNSDEDGCTMRNCSESEFRCDNGQCVSGISRCDGWSNCTDGSDEAKCFGMCRADHFRCKGPPGHCILRDWVCDGESDCNDGSDESDCQNKTITALAPESTSQCGHGRMSCGHLCVPPSWNCDGRPDCPNNHDEDSAVCQKYVCPPSMFRCRNNRCIPGHLTCNKIDNCGDQSDETLPYCTAPGMCHGDVFYCNNGLCLNETLVCNGENDCGDGTDETGCLNAVCRKHTCSQICIAKSGKPMYSYTCKCGPGYQIRGSASEAVCELTGEKPVLLLVNNRGFMSASPYKPRQTKPILASYDWATYKVDDMDVIWDENNVTLFWVEDQGHRIVRANLTHDPATDTYTMTNISTLNTESRGARGVAVDWVGRRLYWAGGERSGIYVGTLAARSVTTLMNLVQAAPDDIAVHIGTRQIIWTDWGVTPRVGIAGMDGTNARTLAKRDVWRPSGLAVDEYANRVYWCDIRTDVLEVINIDGTRRRVLYYFDNSDSEQARVPWRLIVIEESLFGVWRHGAVRINKLKPLGLSVLNVELQSLSAIAVLHPGIQTYIGKNPCSSNPCHSSALCVLSPAGQNYSCLCPDGLVPTSSVMNKERECQIVTQGHKKECTLSCGPGHCQKQPDGQPVCVCPQLYSGTRCQTYLCAGYCQHRGQCYADIAHIPKEDFNLMCVCPPEYTGRRCETPVSRCADQHCHNGATCLTNGTCQCAVGYKGERCEICAGGDGLGGDVDCGPDGVCGRGAGGVVCKCPPGFRGPRCRISLCQDYCYNTGTCVVLANGTATCQCPPGYDGFRCERSPNSYTTESHASGNATSNLPQSCDEVVCSNGGECRITRAGALCDCPYTWTGRYCEEYLGHDGACSLGVCGPGGVCTAKSEQNDFTFCACVHGYQCKHSSGAVCIVDRESVGPFCVCTGNECIGAQADVGNSGRVWTGVVASILFAVLIVATLYGLFLYCRRREANAFMHARLTENVEINNPMYLQGGDDDLDIVDRSSSDVDKNGSSHFANPVYESMYNAQPSPVVPTSQGGISHPNEERANLLTEACEDISATPPPPTAERTLLL